MLFTVAGVSKFYVVNKKIRGQGGQRDIRPSAVIEDYIVTQFSFYVYTYCSGFIPRSVPVTRSLAVADSCAATH